MDQKKLLKIVLYLIFFIFFAHFLADRFYLYLSLWYFDVIMHFLGGLWVGFIFIYIFQPKSASLRTIFQAMVFVLAVGLVWEVYEVLVNDVIAKNPLDIPDTVSDICFDLSGGLCAMLYLWKKLEKKQLK